MESKERNKGNPRNSCGIMLRWMVRLAGGGKQREKLRTPQQRYRSMAREVGIAHDTRAPTHLLRGLGIYLAGQTHTSTLLPCAPLLACFTPTCPHTTWAWHVCLPAQPHTSSPHFSTPIQARSTHRCPRTTSSPRRAAICRSTSPWSSVLWTGASSTCCGTGARPGRCTCSWLLSSAARCCRWVAWVWGMCEECGRVCAALQARGQGGAPATGGCSSGAHCCMPSGSSMMVEV